MRALRVRVRCACVRCNRWVRTSDFTKGEAQANKRVQLLTTGEACKKFLKLTKRWTKPILVRSLRDRPQLYWHAMLNNKVHTPLTPLLSHRALCMPAKGSPATTCSCADGTGHHSGEARVSRRRAGGR